MKEQVILKNINDFNNKSLLIVDDDNPFRERLARAMEKKGFEVMQAQSVQKGIESVKAKKPGFAVVDLRLGDGNGSTCSYSSSNCGKTIERPSDIHTRRYKRVSSSFPS